MNIIKGNIVDIINKRIFKGEIHFTDIIHAIVEKEVKEENYIMPGFVNAHVHIESSMLTPSNFSKYAIKHGTIGIVTDPHEIANICGVAGIQYMINNAQQSPLKIFFTVPSCVPATNFETSGAVIDSKTVCELLQKKDFVALSEVMNFPAVIHNDVEILNKIHCAKQYQKPIDGHAPLLTGLDLCNYVKAGITTDHECSHIDEAIEKISLGMTIQIREGSAAKNFESLFTLIDRYPESVMLCTDDSHPDDLIHGHINTIVHKAFSKHIDYFNVLRAASYNAIKHYKLPIGLLQVNDPSDFIVCADKYAYQILETYINGKPCSTFNIDNNEKNETINHWNPKELVIDDLHIDKNNFYHVIECYDGELLTNDLIIKHEEIFDEKGFLKRGFDKIVVIDRYKAQKPAVGIIKGIHLQKGAFGSTVAHDSHNIIITGHDDESILNVFRSIYKNKGGMASSVGNITLELPLPIAGLMSAEDAETVANRYHTIQSFVKSELGSTLSAPFMTLSFMALLVIPHIKIGDKGLFKINELNYVPLSFS